MSSASVHEAFVGRDVPAELKFRRHARYLREKFGYRDCRYDKLFEIHSLAAFGACERHFAEYPRDEQGPPGFDRPAGFDAVRVILLPLRRPYPALND